jgi:hypothetical protein
MTEQASTNPVKPMTDEEWEKKIAAEKAEAIKPDPVEPAKPAAPPAEEPIMDPIEEEIERRVRERMKKEMEQADKNPETPKPVQPAPQPEPPKQQEPAKPVEPPKQPEQPKQEEVKEDKRVNASNDVSSMVWIPLGSNEELAEAIREVDGMDRRSDQEKQDNPDPYVTRAGLVQVLGQRNIEQRLTTMEVQNTAQSEALKYILYDRIRYLGQEYINDGEIDFDDRRILNAMHEAYHDGLHGNGDLDNLMRDVNALPLKRKD